jgi:hypothetical protein
MTGTLDRHDHIPLMYDDAYGIAGPFSSTEELAEFGECWQRENGDRPTWRSIYLRDPYAPPRVIPPLSAQQTEQRAFDYVILMHDGYYEIAGPFGVNPPRNGLPNNSHVSW